MKPIKLFLPRLTEVHPMQRTLDTVEETARGGGVLDQVLAEMTASPGGPPTRVHEKHGGEGNSCAERTRGGGVAKSAEITLQAF